tara:strand:- start:3792 stop:4382 length:591 start_codon:yes stop_codon:yes gene_type:complete
MSKKYFNRKAKNYKEDIKKFPLGKFRSDEYKKVTKLLGKSNFTNSLELGCGSGFYSKFIRKISKNKVYVIDDSKKMLDNLNLKKVIKINKNVLKININKKFDLVAILGLLEFIRDYKKIFKNLKNNFKDNTILIILLPKNNLLNLIYFLYYVLKGIRIYLHDNRKLIKYLESYNFKLLSKKISYVSNIYVFKKVRS